MTHAAHKLTPFLRELAQHIKPLHHDCSTTCNIARVNVGQTMWISFLYGSVLNQGGITSQKLLGSLGNWRVSADHAYLTCMEAVLEQLELQRISLLSTLVAPFLRIDYVQDIISQLPKLQKSAPVPYRHNSILLKL
jgi:hypothetical protein